MQISRSFPDFLAHANLRFDAFSAVCQNVLIYSQDIFLDTEDDRRAAKLKSTLLLPTFKRKPAVLVVVYDFADHKGSDLHVEQLP